MGEVRGFNRLRPDSAIKYAEKFWNIPCDEGVFWLTNERVSIEGKRKELKAPAADGWQAAFVKGDGTDPEKAVFRRTVGSVVEEKIINGWAGLADCAHFLSRPLSAGGAKVEERGVTELVNTLQGRRHQDSVPRRSKGPGAEGNRHRNFQERRHVGILQRKPNWGLRCRLAFSHSTMYVGKIDAAGVGGVTCHTVARFTPKSWVNDSWWLHDGYTYTLIHFSSDDPPPDRLKVAALEGWWKLDYASRTEYYQIFKDGRAHCTKRAPKSPKDPMLSVEGSAYWFMDAVGKITFIWKATGTVEVWSPAIGGTGYSSMINGITSGTVSKLF